MLRVAGWLLLGLFPLVVTAGEQATRIAVVDVSTVFKHYKKVYDVQRRIDASFEAERRKLEEETRQLGKDVQDVEQMRRDASGDSEFVFERVQSLQKQEFALRKRQRAFQEKQGQRYLEEMKDVLGEIRATIRKSAERGGFQLVVRTADADDPVNSDEGENVAGGKDANPNDAAIREMLQPRHTLDIVVRFKRNPVLYGSPLVDLTAEVSKVLNDEYAKRAGGAPEGK
jgi:Skp family chaperone for outer membrane proteins